jgi:hypothetical protein
MIMWSPTRRTFLASSAAVSALGVLPAAARAAAQANVVRPFRIDVPEEQLADLRRRVRATRWPDRETVTDRSQGVRAQFDYDSASDTLAPWERHQLRVRVPYDCEGKGLRFHGVREEVNGVQDCHHCRPLALSPEPSAFYSLHQEEKGAT